MGSKKAPASSWVSAVYSLGFSWEGGGGKLPGSATQYGSFEIFTKSQQITFIYERGEEILLELSFTILEG